MLSNDVTIRAYKNDPVVTTDVIDNSESEATSESLT